MKCSQSRKASLWAEPHEIPQHVGKAARARLSLIHLGSRLALHGKGLQPPAP